MDPIREMLARLATLTADELAELRSLLSAEFERLDTDESTVEDIALLQELAEFGEQVMAQSAANDAAAAQAQSDREAARERIRALNPPAEPDTPEEPAAPQPAEGEPVAEEDAQTPAVEPAAEPIAATGAVARMAARGRHPAPSPEAASAPAANRTVLTATGALRGLDDPSAPITDRAQFAAAMTQTLQRLPRHGAPRGDVLLATARYEYPQERQLGSDAWENERKMDAVSALTATGGVCLPVNVDYSVPTWATADRPLKDGLPSFEATRGGIRYVQPPDLGNLAAATGIWTEATDLAPGAQTKPIISIACGTEILVYVEAVSTRIGFGNMQSRFAPEQVAANTDLAIAAASRVAENNLLNLIAAACVQNVTAPVVTTNLGATRDLISTLHQAVAAYRSGHRIPPSQTMTAILPQWLRGLIKTDLAREIGHQQDSSWNSLMITDEQVDALVGATGVNPIWHIDGQPSSVAGGVSQAYGIQGTGTLLTFPSKLVFYLFPEGMIQFLDGGRLDLGVVRDSTLDATNDYETFVETFENIAARGFASGAIQYVAALCANGQSAGTVATTGLCA
jgi:hypothetical protein